MTDDKKQEIADAFGLNTDPLADLEPVFNQELSHIDPFEPFIEEILESDSLSKDTIDFYRRDFRDWKAMMDEMNRHPACPNQNHVLEFIEREKQKGNKPEYIKGRIRRLKRVFEYWQREDSFPHRAEFNPFEMAQEKADWGDETKKEHHHVPLDDLRERIRGIIHVQDRAIVVTQLKCMLRARELCNIKLSEINIQHPDVKDAYPELGTHDRVEDRPNTLYIPPNPNSEVPLPGRQGNKSKRPKVIPLDDETRQVLIDYLLVRPDVDSPWLFLSGAYGQIDLERVNAPWHEAFRPEYGETDQHKALSSHFGRHFTTDYLKQEAGMAREKVQYLRGDIVGGTEFGERGAIDTYLHGHFSKVKDDYIEGIFKLGL